MANLKNWQPAMTEAERLWFDGCPKAVLFEIARRLGAQLADGEDLGQGFVTIQAEWRALHANGIVPQKPVDPERALEKLNAVIAARAAFRARRNASGSS